LKARRVGQEHAAYLLTAVAGNWRIPAPLQRNGIPRAGEIGHAAREAAAFADADDVFTAARADFADRCERQIMPLLHGRLNLVLADRYIYTAFARDAGGLPGAMAAKSVPIRPIPDITFYFRAPLDVAVNRILSGRPRLKYYEAGMDLGMSYAA